MQTDYPQTLQQLGEILEAVDEMQAELKRLRDAVPDNLWDDLADGPFGDLLAHCLEIEHRFEK
jgi:hypothetical protein